MRTVLVMTIMGRLALQTSLDGETDDSRKVRFAHVRETSIELRESCPILRESSEVNVITLSQCPPLQQGWCSLLDQPCTAKVLRC